MDTPISWYPGHMSKARRQIVSGLRLVDAVIEVVDARAPASSTNPDLQDLTRNHRRMVVATKADLADEAASQRWIAYYRSQGIVAVAADLRQASSRKHLLRELRGLKPKGSGARLKVMVIGTPNVGKSTLVNRIAGRAPTRTGARPGITRGAQWIHIPGGIHLLDTPGMMWPKIESVEVGLRLAWIGSIGENAYDAEETAQALVSYLAEHHKDRLVARYKIDPEVGNDLLLQIAKVRGMFVAGGEGDRRRAAETVLKEFRTGLLGRITLEFPEE